MINLIIKSIARILKITKKIQDIMSLLFILPLIKFVLRNVES